MCVLILGATLSSSSITLYSVKSHPVDSSATFKTVKLLSSHLGDALPRVKTGWYSG